MCVNVPREVFFLPSGVLVECQQPHTSAEFHRISSAFVIWHRAERKAVQESYLLVNLNDMFLQQNQTKKQWKWWKEEWEEGEGVRIWMREQQWGAWNHQQWKHYYFICINDQMISIPHFCSVIAGVAGLAATLRAF